MIRQKLIQLKRWLLDECPECEFKLDHDVHGYDRKWAHCWRCGYCTMARYYGHKDCGVRHG